MGMGGYLAFAERCGLLALLWMAVVCAGAQEPKLPPYYFANFEPKSGWAEGALTLTKSSINLAQGDAEIRADNAPDSGYHLALTATDPFGAVWVDSSPVSKNNRVYCELQARPVAGGEDHDAEFLDFGGAVLGFFRVGGRGEIRALYGRTAEESVWISTGLRFELDDTDAAADWMQILIELDQRQGRWNLTVNGTPVLRGLRVSRFEEAGALKLWLYGQSSGVARFDDLLLCGMLPDDLEKVLAVRMARRPRAAGHEPIASRKLVTGSRKASGLRSLRPTLRKAPAVPLIVDDWNLTLETGGRSARSQPTPRVNVPPDQRMRIIPFAPAYDDNGNVLPGVITITAEAALQPGTDLSRLRWRVAELKGFPDKLGETAAEGDFRTGLVQTATLAPEWMKKALHVNVWIENPPSERSPTP
jgi:hypothetical protein